MESPYSLSRALKLWHCLFLISAFSMAQPAAANCRTGGESAAKAYILFNPFYSYFFEPLEEYVSENREHFQEGGDAVACLREMADAIASAGARAFDPDDLERQERINRELAQEGIGPKRSMSASTQLQMEADQMRRLGRGLPDAADGDMSTLYTATTDEEQMMIFAENILRDALAHDPTVQQAMNEHASEIKELANLEYRMHVQLAQQLASSGG